MGSDGFIPGLPCNELLAPAPLAALVLVAMNDWWWKPGAVLPPWLTGKLSDLAGVFALPLVLTAVVALALRGAARLGLTVDWTLRRWKLAIAVGLTAGAVIASKLSPTVATLIADALGHDARIVADPSDLIALPMLGLTWWHGRRTIARVPYGRIAWLRSARRSPAVALADVGACGGSRPALATLVRALDDDDPAAVTQALGALRAITA